MKPFIFCQVKTSYLHEVNFLGEKQALDGLKCIFALVLCYFKGA